MKISPPFPASLDAIRAASQALHTPALGAEELQTNVENMLLHEITNQPRSLQKRIGPSELGTPCTHCLAAKLAGWEQRGQGIPWASTVGTAIHSLIEDFVYAYQGRGGAEHPRFFTEQTVTVGQIGGEAITGSIDLLDVAVGATVDWKCVSPTALGRYRRQGPGQTYRAQAHLYAKGCNDAGIPVSTVSICFLPRASSNFYDRHWWSEAYNPQIAADALARANQIHANLAALTSLGEAVRDQWITSQPRDPDCYDCARYQDAPQATPVFGGVTFDLPTQ